MSVRAYRVIKIERAENPSFNLWHDDRIIDFLDEHEERQVSYDLGESGGQIEVSVSTIKKLLKQKEIQLDEYHIKAFKDDIAFAKSQNDDYILYDCF